MNNDILAATVALYTSGSPEAFDPSSPDDQAWFTATYLFVKAVVDDVGQAEIQANFPGAQVVAPAPAPAPVPAVPLPVPVPQPAPAVPVPAVPVPVPQPPVMHGAAPMPAGNPEPFPVPQAVAPVVPLPGVPQAPVPASTPAPVAGLDWSTSKQDQWAYLIQEFQTQGRLTTWYDNRLSKRGPTYPDFRHMTIDQAPGQNGKIYKLSLYLKDAPDFALQALAQYPPSA